MRGGSAIAAATLLGTSAASTTAAPQSYRAVEWAHLPAGTNWQAMSAVDIDSRGRIYALQRGAPAQVMVFSRGGRLLRTWGRDAFPDAHGLRIDNDDNVWITDRRLHQVLKFTSTGAPLLTIGIRGVAGDDRSTVALNGPSDVAFGRDGDVFVSDGESTNARILRYARDGRLLSMWGSRGAGPGQFDVPHAIVADAQGHLYVADRDNRRIEIFDGAGHYLGQRTDLGRPFGVDVDRDGRLYVVDGSKGAEQLSIVDPTTQAVVARFAEGLEGAHMLAVDRHGAIYVAEVRERSIRKFIPVRGGRADR